MILESRFRNEIDRWRAANGGRSLVRIGDRAIGDGEPTYVVAEAAANHMCDMGMAKALVDKAVEAGADAIKFQTYKAARLVRADATLYWNGQETSQLEYYSRLDRFGHAEYQELFAYARSKGIEPFSTPFDLDSADLLNQLGCALFKIASCDLPDKRLLAHVAGFGKPVVLSTGGSKPEEVDAALTTIFNAGNMNVVLLACTLSYPTPMDDAQLLRIQSWKERYPSLVIGLSDHTEPDAHMVIPALAVALGANLIEKHYTLDRTMTGSGHSFSVNPADLAAMVENIRLAERVLGRKDLGVLSVEAPAREKARRSIVAEVAIPKGTVITSAMLGMKRPADGLPGTMIDQVMGRAAATDIAPDQPITLDLLQ